MYTAEKSWNLSIWQNKFSFFFFKKKRRAKERRDFDGFWQFSRSTLQFAIEQRQLYRRNPDSVLYCRTKMPNTILKYQNPLNACTSQPRIRRCACAASICACTRKQNRSQLPWAFHGDPTTLWFARSGPEDSLILFVVARLPNGRLLVLQQRDGLLRILQVSEQSL